MENEKVHCRRCDQDITDAKNAVGEDADSMICVNCHEEWEANVLSILEDR
jgi:hypothetical protein